jgi:dihydroneopterin aldolase
MIERIHIEQLKVQAHVGVPADERSQPQRLTINVTVWPRVAEQRDELENTINYSRVAKTVREVVRHRHFKLIETVAEEVAAQVLRQFDPEKVMVEVRKFVLPDADYVSVTAVQPVP